jgi:5'-3' exonuclease
MYEADDLIATLVHQFNEGRILDDTCLIVSGDKDMFQLITNGVHVVSPAIGYAKHDVEYDEAKAKEKFGVSPDMLADYLSLLGDNSDNIPGVAKVGEKTALQLLIDNGPIRNWINSIDTITATDKIKQNLRDSREQLFINKKLISLKNVKVTLNTPPVPTDLPLVESVFNKYEMRKIRPEYIFEMLAISKGFKVSKTQELQINDDEPF